MPDALPAVTEPSLPNDGRQAGEAFERRVRTQVVVLLDAHGLAPGLDLDGHDLLGRGGTDSQAAAARCCEESA